MSDSGSATSLRAKARDYFDFAAIFVAALILGVAYNTTSPLGVRAEGIAAPVIAPAPPPLADPALHNETLTAAIIGTSLPPETSKLIAAMAWAEVKPLLASGEIILVDGRDAVAFEAGHIPGAVSLPLDALKEKIAEFSQQYPKTKPVVTYCGSVGCPIAHLMAAALGGEYGYADVREMPGGYVEWRTAEAGGKQ